MNRSIAIAPGAIWLGLCLVLAPTTKLLAYPLVVGAEFSVNSNRDDPGTTADNDQEAPDVAMDAEGNFVVVFQRDTPGPHITVAARLFDASGTPKGPEYRVNTTGANDRMAPQVAMHSAGHFVVVWADNFADHRSDGVMARFYYADGQPKERFDDEGESLGAGNFRINSSTEGRQYRADVAVAANGNIVVVWEDDRFADFKSRIRGKVYGPQGYALTGELSISDDMSIDHTWPRVAVDRQGKFTVAWQSGNVGRNSDLAMRRFDALGSPVSGAVLINGTSRVSHASGVHRQSGIGMDAAGNTVVVWRADNYTGPGLEGTAIGILGRRFAASGDPIGAVFEVETAQAPLLNNPDVAMNEAGHFLIAYEAADASLSGIMVRQYYDDGLPRGGATQTNTFETLVQSRPSAALDARANAVVSWQSNNQDEAGRGVFGRRVEGFAPRPRVDFNRDTIADLAWRNSANGQNAIMTINASGLGVISTFVTVADQRWQVAGMADFNCDGYTDIFWHNRASGENAVLFMVEFDDRSVVFAPRLADTKWRVVDTGDFDRDCRADILWRHDDSGELLVWLIGKKGVATKTIAKPGPQWRVVAVADFDGDRRADILGRSRTGENAIVLMDGTVIRDVQLIDTVADLNWQVVDAGDFDGDGKADIFWRNVVSGENALFMMDTFELRESHAVQAMPDLRWRVEGIRDFNGDGRSDLVWRHGVSGSVVRWIMDGFEVESTQSIVTVADSNWLIVP